MEGFNEREFKDNGGRCWMLLGPHSAHRFSREKLARQLEKLRDWARSRDFKMNIPQLLRMNPRHRQKHHLSCLMPVCDKTYNHSD